MHNGGNRFHNFAELRVLSPSAKQVDNAPPKAGAVERIVTVTQRLLHLAGRENLAKGSERGLPSDAAAATPMVASRD